MLTLKKSFELSNHLNDLMARTLNILGSTGNITTVTQTHQKTKSYAEATDEVKIKDKPTELPCTVMQLVDFALDLQKEIDKLTIAMDTAKHSGDVDYDVMISINNAKRKLVTRFETMAGLKSKTEMANGTDYKFNGEGNQVSYVYPVEEVTTIDFDRNQIKGIIRRLGLELDEYSASIDRMGIDTMVDYEVVYDVMDKLDDAIEKFVSSHN